MFFNVKLSASEHMDHGDFFLKMLKTGHGKVPCEKGQRKDLTTTTTMMMMNRLGRTSAKRNALLIKDGHFWDFDRFVV
jgi:hypothetical protein